MSSNQPVSGSLSAKVIRACTAHAQCPLECPERKVEELGTIASFDNRPWRSRLRQQLEQFHQGGPHGQRGA